MWHLFLQGRFLGLVLALVSAGFVVLAPNSVAASKFSESDFQTFIELLGYYKNNPEFRVEVMGSSNQKFSDPREELIRKLAPNVLDARFKKFNIDYRDFLKQVTRLESQLVKLDREIKQMSLSDTDRRSLHEIKIETQKSKIVQIKKVLYVLSIEANESLQRALTTLTAKQVIAASEKTEEAPKMPGVYGGSLAERQKLKEIDKLNLTPVDPEFYESQLGRKLEKDLGGRAQFWSYNYEADELYVKVGGELGKLRVRQDNSGSRFIQTRVGASFVEPRGSDEKVDEYNAQGKFLTGDTNAESLFGAFPDSEQKFLDENRKDSGGGTHDHDH
ncbi:hypothetical protein GW916_07600 [bacterium]|nr:hypothetical protein [bacterium]